MKIAVTGGSGFLGTELIRSLLSLGHKVTILDLEPPDASIASNVTFIQGDITNVALLKSAISGNTLVYHIAAIVPIEKRRRAELLAVNAGGTRAVLEAAHASGARVVFCSTSSPLYDRVNHLPVTEKTPQSPAYGYGHSKQAAEVICREYRAQGVPIAIVRPRMIVGPGRLGLLQILSEWVADGSPIPLIGGGSNRLQLLDVSDLVDFLILLLNAPNELFNDDYNIGTNSFTTLKNDIGYVIQKTGSTSKIVAIPPIYRPLLALCNIIGFTPITFFHLNTIDRDFYFDTTKAERTLGWKPRFSNAEGLLRSYEWYQKNKAMLPIGSGHRQKLRSFGILAAVPIILLTYDVIVRSIGWFAELIATGFGIGKTARIAPSSHGALLGMPAIPFFLLAPWYIQATIIMLALIFGAYIAGVTEKRLGTTDARPIVIDEMVSVFITFFAIPFSKISLPILILGFVLNRVFDIVKPFPARLAERLPHGVGIMADDVVSGIYSWVVLFTIVALFM